MKLSIGVVAKPGTSRATKTGSWRTYYPVGDPKKCTACGICAMYCPEGIILIDKVKKFSCDLDYCKGCGICAQVCPFKAIEMKLEVR